MVGVIRRPFSASGCGYIIEKSALFDDGYMTQTMVTGNRRTFTIEWWAKRNGFGGSDQIINKADGVNQEFRIEYAPDDQLRIKIANSGNYVLDTVARDREISAYAHHCVQIDTTQAVEEDRVKHILNGILQTMTGTYPPLNLEIYWNFPTSIAYLGRYYVSNTLHYKARVAELRNVDGDATVCSGAFDAEGYWNPEEYKGDFGTSGFYLDFKDALDLGKDVSGNDNHWTVNGTVIQSSDSPTDSIDLGCGNFPIWNHLNLGIDAPLTNGNRTITAPAGTSGTARWTTVSTLAVGSTNIYFEFDLTSTGPQSGILGFHDVALSDLQLRANLVTIAAGELSGAYAWMINPSGACAYYNNGVSDTTNHGTPAYGERLACAYDPSTGKMWFRDSVGWNDSGNPSTGINPAMTVIAAARERLIPFGAPNADGLYGTSFTAYFAEDEWDYAPPAGFKALATQNMPKETLVSPQTGSFTGNANADGAFVYLGFRPDTDGTCTINGNPITWGTHALATATGFKLITSSANYNLSGTNTFSIEVDQITQGGRTPRSQARAKGY